MPLLPPYCKFFGMRCIEHNCPAFQIGRPWTKREIQKMNSADIPAEYSYRGKTCLRYGDLVYEIVDQKE